MAAGVAKVAAETAEANAETAQAASETAKTASEAAKVAAETAETNASTSAATATTQAGIATTKAGEASTSATAAEASKVAAAASQVAASNSQVAAASSASSAAAIFDQFDDTYLGSKSVEPTVDNDGNALVTGALFYNSATGGMFIWDGTEWIAASSAGGVSLNNFAFTASAGQTTFSGTDDNSNTLVYTQDNLILILNGVILEAGTDYTATDGTTIVLTDATVVNDELNVVAFKTFTTADMVSSSNGGIFYGNVDFSAGIDVTGNITVTGTVDGRDVAADGAIIDSLGTAATTASTDYATAAQGALADSATQPGDLATVATSGAYSDLSGTPTLGTAASTASSAYATAAQGALAASATQPADNISTLTNDAGYTTNVGDITGVTAGSGITGGGTSGTVTLNHADTSSVANSDNSGNTFIQDINFDGFGHVTSVGTGTVSVGDGTLTVQGTGALGGSGTFSANQSGNATISISHDDTSSQASVNNSGATVIQDVTLDGYGHITGLASKTLTLADLGGSASADSIQALSSQPATRSAGDIYFNTTEGQLYIGTSTDWEGLLNLAPETTGGTSTLSTVNHGASVSYDFGTDFTDPNYADSALTYTLDSGTLPSGTSISGQNLTGTSVGSSTATTYNFSITATNPGGLAGTQAYQMTVNAIPNNASNGEAIFTSNSTWTVPAGVFNVCVVCVGAGGAGQGNYGAGGGGGALAWANQIEVIPGQTYSIVVGQGAAATAGGDSYVTFGSQGTVRANGGESTSAQVTYANGGQTANTIANSGGGYGGRGGRGRAPNPYHVAGAGGGAGGYSGAGGNGSAFGLDTGTAGTGGGGGGGGNRYSDPTCGYSWATGGGGVGLNGEGSNGQANQSNTYNCQHIGTAYGGGGGSGGASAGSSTSGGTNGGAYGGGGGSGWPSGGARGGHGAVRIVWKTATIGNYGFPSTNVN